MTNLLRSNKLLASVTTGVTGMANNGGKYQRTSLRDKRAIKIAMRLVG